MDDKKEIYYDLFVFMGGTMLLHACSMEGANINDRSYTEIILAYLFLFVALDYFYTLLKNGKKQFARKIEYARLLTALLFVVTFAYNLFFI